MAYRSSSTQHTLRYGLCPQEVYARVAAELKQFFGLQLDRGNLANALTGIALQLLSLEVTELT